LLQQHGLAGAEAAGDGGCRAAGKWEQQVQHPRAGAQRDDVVEALTEGSRSSYRPWFDQPHGTVADLDHRGVVGDQAGGGGPRQLAGDAGRAEHPVLEGAGVRDHPQHCTGLDACPHRHRCRRREAPDGVTSGLGPLGREPHRRVGQAAQQPIEDTAQQTGTEAGRQWLAHLHHRVADPQAAGVLEGLHGDEVAVDADRLAGGAQRPHLDGVEHGHVVEPRRLDERAAHPDHPAGRRPAWVAHASHDRRICTAEASNARSASVGSEKSTRRTPSVATIPPSSGSPSTAADPRAARARSDRRASIRG